MLYEDVDASSYWHWMARGQTWSSDNAGFLYLTL
jgi:hypothetical protein